MNRHFKPLIERLRLFIDNLGLRATKRKSRNEDATSVSKHERKEEKREEKEEASETFEHSTTLYKSNDQSHRVQSIHLMCQNRTDDRIVGK